HRRRRAPCSTASRPRARSLPPPDAADARAPASPSDQRLGRAPRRRFRSSGGIDRGLRGCAGPPPRRSRGLSDTPRRTPREKPRSPPPPAPPPRSGGRACPAFARDRTPPAPPALPPPGPSFPRASPAFQRLFEELGKVGLGHGARRQLGHPGLRQRALDESGDVGLARADRSEPVRHFPSLLDRHQAVSVD